MRHFTPLLFAAAVLSNFASAHIQRSFGARIRGANEPNSEKKEEKIMAGMPDESNALNSAIGAPHEGHGLEKDVPMTVAEDQLEGNHAIDSVHSLAMHVVMPAAGIFLICIILGNALTITKWGKWFPESAATLFVAIVLGLVIRHGVTAGFISVKTFTFVNATILNLVLLPIIIFNGGWNLRRKDFASQFEYILIFAVFGTLISTFFIGYASYYMGTLGWHPLTGLRENMVFAALISAVDPVATLTTYNALGVEPLLNIMVFGESTINDAVAIVLFNVFNKDWEHLHPSAAVLKMGVLLFGSMGFGILLAGILILMIRLVKLSGHSHAEILFIWMSAYFIFAAAESFHFSGIIANLFAGMVFGIYSTQHLSEKGRATANEYLTLCSATADNGVFILCGTSVALMQSMSGFKFGFIAVGLCFVGRFLSVVPCAAVSNVVKKFQGEPNHLSWKHQVMMWHGGLRGGIALVLALDINGEWCSNKATILNATFTVICVLLLVLGGTTEFMLEKLGIGMHVHAAEDALVVQDRYYLKMFKGIDKVVQFVLVGNLRKVEELDEE